MSQVATFAQSGEPLAMTSVDLLSLVNKARADFGEKPVRHNDFASRCRDELDGEVYETFVVPPQTTASGRIPAFDVILMSRDQCKLVAMRESKGVRRSVLARLNELEAQAAPALPDFTNPAIAARAWAEQFEAKQQVEQQLAIAAPKAQALDRISKADGELCITDTAKAIQMPPRKLFAWMQSHGWIFRRGDKWVAYQDRIQSGHLTHRITLLPLDDGSNKEVTGVMVTAKGQAKLAQVAV